MCVFLVLKDIFNYLVILYWMQNKAGKGRHFFRGICALSFGQSQSFWQTLCCLCFFGTRLKSNQVFLTCDFALRSMTDIWFCRNWWPFSNYCTGMEAWKPSVKQSALDRWDFLIETGWCFEDKTRSFQTLKRLPLFRCFCLCKYIDWNWLFVHFFVLNLYLPIK